MYLVSGHPKLAQKQYKRIHENVSRRVHWELYKKHGLEISDRWSCIHLLNVAEKWGSRIILGSYYADKYESGTQQGRHYPSWEGNTEMDNHWYCCSKWLQCSQNRGLKSWEVSWASIQSKENPSCRDSNSTSCIRSSMNSSKATHQVNWAFRHLWHNSQHSNDSSVRNSRNTMQGDESLSYKAISYCWDTVQSHPVRRRRRRRRRTIIIDTYRIEITVKAGWFFSRVLK